MKMEQKILDISKWQTCIDFQKVKNSGVSGVMIRACYGEFEDSLFKQHIKGALSVGLKVGAYLYSLAHNPATAYKETTAFLKIIEPFNISLFCAIDMEDNIQLNLTNSQRSEIVNTFKELVNKDGKKPMLYASRYWLETKFERLTLYNIPLWVAEWSAKCSIENATMWQYGQISVDGVRGKVDGNILFEKSESTIQKENNSLNLKNEPLYPSSTAKQPTNKVTGKYFYYDNKVINGRRRITNSADRIGKSPIGLNVTGFINNP